MSQPTKSSSWTSFLKSITSFNGDLSSLTAPPFILSPTSLAEYPKYWGEHPDLFIEPALIKVANGTVPAATLRMLSVIKWFISTLKSQYTSRNESMGSEKKPLNPYLGELFVGKWDKNAEFGDTVLLSEQVSHHPPITAYTIFNDKHRIRLEGYNQIKASISKMSLNVKQYGNAILRLDEFDEQYLITFPPLHLEGLLSASPFVELEGKSYIQASNGLFCVIEYSGRGYFSGKKNTFKAMVYSSSAAALSEKRESLFTISGQWSGTSYLREGAEAVGMKPDQVFYNAKDAKAVALSVKPIEEQHPLESRKAWAKIAAAIQSGNYDAIHVEKSALETQQRELRKLEKTSGSQWKQRWFVPVDNENPSETDDFLALANKAQLSTLHVPSGTLSSDKYATQGAAKPVRWVFKREFWDSEKEVHL